MNPARLPEYARRLGMKPMQMHGLVEAALGEPWRVSSVERGRCLLLGLGADGELTEARARTGETPVAVGDWVVLDQLEAELPRVARVLERSSVLKRGSAHREGDLQLIAANLDTVFVVVAFAQSAKLERRALRARRLDRFIAAVAEDGVRPVVVLNKLDVSDRDAEEQRALRSELEARLGGLPVLLVSAHTGDGLDELRAWLVPGETLAFIGPSGVGKSSLINALLGEAHQRVGEVRHGDSKGRHTTTRRELLILPSGALLVDTPGVREFAVVSESTSGFEDIESLAERCRFADCAHSSEPGCAVRDAVDAGKLPEARLQSYLDLVRDARRLQTKHDAYARHLEKAEGKRFGRMVKKAMAAKKRRTPP